MKHICWRTFWFDVTCSSALYTQI